MSDGRALVYPQALLFGVRLLPVPGQGTVLCASAGLPIRLSDGSPLKPNDYYAAVSTFAGKAAIPDSMAPLPGSELLILGPIARPLNKSQAQVQCGSIHSSLLLHPDPQAKPDSVFTGSVDDAVWHAEKNPTGRGGPEDERKPLIEREGAPDEPIWLGATPFDHPIRMRLAGESKTIRNGWPSDANPAALCDAHEAFQTSSLHGGDKLKIEGLSDNDIKLELPSYRAVMATSRLPSGKWHKEPARIHTVVVIPAADVGAIFWRAAVELGKDLLGQKIIAAVVALEDVVAPEKDAEDLGIIAAERWLEPTRALDDRPLLPAAMAAEAAPPPLPDNAVENQRHEAAKNWARKEFGLEGLNPFEDPDAVAEGDAIMEDAADGEAPDIDKLGAIGEKAMAESKSRHAEAGFEPPEPENQRPPVERGELLEIEARDRLSQPYCSPREITMMDALRQAPAELEVDGKAALSRMAEARIIAVEPVLFWPAFQDAEAVRFGEEAFRALIAADLQRHIDISGAHIVADSTTTGSRRVISNRSFGGLLAEETVWQDIEFTDCNFNESTFAKGKFDNCLFLRCNFEKVNFSEVTLQDVIFKKCVLREQSAQNLNCITGRFDECDLESLTFIDLAMRDTVFNDGSWREIEFSDCLLMRIAMCRTPMTQVTYTQCHVPESRFEQLTMHKVWVMGYGFAQSYFDGVKADTCGFVGNAHFQQSRFVSTSFEQTGFSKARFDEAEIASDCVFTRCDFTGTQFTGSRSSGVRFFECTFPMSVWMNAEAAGTWFMDAVLRAVDFSKTNLTNAIFAGSDIEGAVFDDRLVTGADFRGTVRASAE